MEYVNTFTRTFLQIATPAFIAAASADWVNGDRKLNASALGLGLMVAFVGALVAAGQAIVANEQDQSRTAKSVRSAVQAAVGVVAAFGTNAIGDVVLWPVVFVGGASLIVGAFVSTYLSYKAPPAVA